MASAINGGALIGDLPLDSRGGATLYDRIGDSFGWFCIGLSVVLVAWSFFARKTRQAQRAD